MLKTGLGGLCVAFCFVAVTLSGCGGGGGGGDGGGTSPGSPVLQSSTEDYDFGNVTLGNSPAAKVITLSNSGNAPLAISDIAFADAGFILDLDSEAGFCGSTTPTIAVGGSCVVAVGFNPTTAGPYSDTLSVSSNDPDASRMDFLFTGTGVAVTVPTLQINRVEPDNCPSSELSLYLSVTDQLGYPISGLTDFTVTETSIPMSITYQEPNVSSSMSIALVMDYSFSITSNPDVQEGMEAGVISFINGLRSIDEAEIIKFDSIFETVQPFTVGDAAGQAALIVKVTEAWDNGRGTRLNDAIYQAVDDLALRSKDRKIIIVLSDGFDGTNPPDDPSDYNYDQARNHAVDEGVHVFPVGIAGTVDDLNDTILEALASETGGQYFDTLVADDLNTIYQQLAQIIFVDQYLLTYDSEFTSGESALLRIGVTLTDGSTGEDSRIIEPCP